MIGSQNIKLYRILLTLILLFHFSFSTDFTHTIVLNDTETTIDGTKITSDEASDVYIQDGQNIIHYESEYASEAGYGDSTSSAEWHSIEDCNKEKLITITKAGSYLISGTLNGQLSIEGSEKDEFILYLNGVSITSNVAPGLIFYKANEIDNTEYASDNAISYSAAIALDFSSAGVKIIIKDDTENRIQGSHVANCYKYTTNNDGTRKYSTDIRAFYKAAFYSTVSMSIDGETKKNGILNIVADNEGIGTAKHLLINGGVINILSQDDCINAGATGGSVILINGGNFTINGGLGSGGGDGIDSNGYLIINGGTFIAAASPIMDSGLDCENSFIINGGSIISVGSNSGGTSTNCQQCTFNLYFTNRISQTSTLVIKDDDSSIIASFNPSQVELFAQSQVRCYKGGIISNSDIKLNKNYYLYIDDVQYCYSEKQDFGGFDVFEGGTAQASNKIFTLTSNVGFFTGIQICSGSDSTTSSESSSISSTSQTTVANQSSYQNYQQLLESLEKLETLYKLYIQGN